MHHTCHTGFRIPTDASASIPAVARTFRDDLDNLARKASGLIFHVDTPSTQQLCFRWGVVQCSMSPVQRAVVSVSRLPEARLVIPPHFVPSGKRGRF